MLTINMSSGMDEQYDISTDVEKFVEDFSDIARGLIVDDAYYEIINSLLTDLFNNKLPADGEISEKEIGELIDSAYWGTGWRKNRSVAVDAQYWIHDYVMYGLYLGDAAKFDFSRNSDSARGVRMTGKDSGYWIVLNYNNQGVEDPISFQITAISADSIYVHGGVSGNYIDKEMNAKSAIELLLNY